MTRFFGERWDAPRVDGAVQVPTPVGEECMDCGELIEAGDRGLVQPVLMTVDEVAASEGEHRTVEVGEGCSVAVRSVHLECDLRGTMSHMVGECRCYVPGRSVREEARATLDRVNEWRAGEGLGPL